jgi:hypothetical protein
VPLRNPGTNLAHDLLDIDVLAIALRFRRRRRGTASLRAASILPAPPTMKVRAPAVL